MFRSSRLLASCGDVHIQILLLLLQLNEGLVPISKMLRPGSAPPESASKPPPPSAR